MRLPRPLALLVCLGMGVLLSACGAGSVTSTVTRFHAPALPVSGASFTILPEKNQTGGLEFETYAQQVASELSRRGFRPVPARDKADLVVHLFYGVDQGRTETWSTPVYGGYDDYWRRYYGGLAAWPYPYYDQVGTQTYSATIFTRWLEMIVLDGPALRGGSSQELFRGRAYSEGASRELVTTMPYLIGAMFEGFPGTNAQPQRVTIDKQAPGPRY